MEELRIVVRTAPVDCWACGAETYIVSSVLFSRGSEKAECSISDFTTHPWLVDQIQSTLRSKREVGAIKPRFSNPLGRSYMSNGCAHCDALFGRHFEIHARYSETVASKFIPTDAFGWNAMFDDLLASEDGHLMDR